MRRALLVGTALILGLSGMPRLAEPRPAGDPASLTVLSLNLAMREDVGAIAAELDAFGGRGADLILLQEVVKPDDDTDVASRLGEQLGLTAVYRNAFATSGGRRAGLALLTRYPLHSALVLPLRRFDLSFRSRHRIALGAVIETPTGPVQVFNVHLDTRINLADRLEQLGAVIDAAQALDRPVIVGGDFNSNDNRWLFHTVPLPFIGHQSAGLLAYMEGLGFRSAFGHGRPTHDALGMQLDWVFLRGLRPTAARIVPVKLSDHHALEVAVLPDEPDAPGSQ